MKKLLLVSAALFLVLGLAATGLAEEKTMTGYLADANCAKDHEKASSDHTACARSCVSRGASWALSLPDNHVLLEIDGKLADSHAGHKVTVKGDFDADTNTLKVADLEHISK